MENSFGLSSYKVWTFDCKPASIPCDGYTSTTWLVPHVDIAHFHYVPKNLISWIN